MITHKKGCLIKALKNKEVDYIVHCCNAKGVMGSGIAKTIKEEIPEAFDEYLQNHLLFKEVGRTSLGSLTFAEGVINLVGQEDFGRSRIFRYGNYGAIASGLAKLDFEIGFNLGYWDNYTPPCDRKIKIGFPYNFASDRAGCEWEIIEELIEHLVATKYDVFIYDNN